MWLIPSSIRSRFVPESACSTKGSEPDANTSESDLAFWLTLSGTATQRPRSWRGWTNRAWSQRLFGAAISNASLADWCVAGWIASLPGFPVSRGAPQERSAEPMMPDGSGLLSLESFAKLNRHCAGSKTCQDLFLEAVSNTSYLNLPGSGSMRNGLIRKQPRWVPRTNANASSSWPSARAEDAESCGNHPGAMDSLSGAIAQWETPNAHERTFDAREVDHGIQLANQVSNWPTATAQDAASSSADAKYGTVNRTPGTTLTDAIRKWQSPRASEAEHAGRVTRNHNGQIGLAEQTNNWPTPNASLVNDGESPETFFARAQRRKVDKNDNGNGNGTALTIAAKAWPTPAARDQKGENSPAHMIRTDGRSTNHADQLPNFVMLLYSHPDQPIPDGETSSESAPAARPRLNPVFVCWLMGWPSHWTRAEPISSGAQETALWRCKLQQHLSCLLDE